MVGIQLGLIDTETGATIVEPEEIHTEDDYSFKQMLIIAHNYGAEKGRLLKSGKLTDKELDQRILGLIDGLALGRRSLSAPEREWLRNTALTASQAWLKAQQS